MAHLKKNNNNIIRTKQSEQAKQANVVSEKVEKWGIKNSTHTRIG